MVKTYLKYSLASTLGQIVSNTSNIALMSSRRAIVTACNDTLLLFDIKTGELIAQASDQKIKITHISISANTIAIGYENGSVAIVEFNSIDNTLTFTNKKYFNHKSTVSDIDINENKTLMMSGSFDTNVVIYDMIGDIATKKLVGHKDNIIKCMFYGEDIALSLSKDNSFKIWNLKNQVCIYTHVDVVNKLSNFLVINNDVIFGSYDDKIKIYELNVNNEDTEAINTLKKNDILKAKGIMKKYSKSKVVSFCLSEDEKVFGILSADSSVEFFKVLSKTELRNRLIATMISKDKNGKKEKLIKDEKFKIMILQAKSLIKSKEYNYSGKYKSLFSYEGLTSKKNNNNHKIFDSLFIDNNTFAVASNKNSIDIIGFSTMMLTEHIYTADKTNCTIEEINNENDELEVSKKYSLESMGHREAVRFVQFCRNSSLFITLSNDCAKLWRTSTFKPIKTMNMLNASSATFIYKDSYIALATRGGQLYIIDTNSFEIASTVEKAHENEIWSVTTQLLSKTSVRLLTCSSDKKIKYWTVSFIENENKTNIKVELYNEITVIDSVTYLSRSPDGKYLAYALMDNSIKIIFEDTQKFFLSLYGHKMPVSSFDISSDGALLVSGSADKNVKIWGMDFGDCHKSFIAHTDVVTCVKFVKDTHYFFSSGKDGVVKYYDGDLFEVIYEYTDDFFGSVWWLDVNNEGAMFIAVSADFSIKAYEITEEQIVPKFAYDAKVDSVTMKEAEKEMDKKDAIANVMNKDIETLVPIKKRMDNIGYAEDIMEGLLMCDKYKQEVYNYEMDLEDYKKSLSMLKSKNKDEMEKVKAYNLQVPEPPVPSPKMLNMNIFDYILWRIKLIRSTELESTMNNIPYSYFQSFLFYLEYYIRNNIEVELITRIVVFFGFLYQKQMSNDKTILKYLISIKEHLKGRMMMNYDILNFNVKSIDLILRNNELRDKAIEDFKEETRKNNAFSFNI